MKRTFKKTLWNGVEWEIINFYELDGLDFKIVDWCKSHYKRKHDTWYTTFSTIVMSEKIYIHWKLCE